jgi:hypothetical protein
MMPVSFAPSPLVAAGSIAKTMRRMSHGAATPGIIPN